MSIAHFKEYLQKDLKNDAGFYKDVVGTFSAKVSSLSDTHIREKNLHSNIWIKQINVCWLKIIKSLREMINELDVVKSKRGDILFKLVDLTKESDDPNLLMDTLLLYKDKLLERIDVLKVAWASEFTDSIELSKKEVEKWLLQYITRNDEVDNTLHQLGMDTREMKNELF